MKAIEARKMTEKAAASIYQVALEQVYDKIKAAASCGKEDVILELSTRCTEELVTTLRQEGYRVVAKNSPHASSLDMVKISW